MSEVRIRVEGRAGRITLTRPGALNALTYAMVREIDAALALWADDPAVVLVLLEGEGRSFCAGGDIAEIYAAGRRGDPAFARRFWRDEYRMNARLARYPKPVVALMKGFVMGGGVGLACHGSHRIVGESAKVAMPECGIGLVPDVGGSLLLARAPGYLGEYLGLTGTRMGPGDAMATGFADYHVPEREWSELTPALLAAADVEAVEAAMAAAVAPSPRAPLLDQRLAIDSVFGAPDWSQLLARLAADEAEPLPAARDAIARGAPLALAATLALVREARRSPRIESALAAEFRFTWRAAAEGNFLEGIRARIIDKDNAPIWRHAAPGSVTPRDVAAALAPLGDDELVLR